jgi:hypothetical protein
MLLDQEGLPTVSKWRETHISGHLPTGTTGDLVGEKFNTSLGNGMVPKSQRQQTFLTTCPWKAEQFTLNLRQRYDSMLAIVLGKAQCRIAG